MWDAPQGTDDEGTFAWPRIRYVMLDVSDDEGIPVLTPIEDSSIADPDFALFLASSAVNADGYVGGTLAMAGGTTFSPIYPGCGVWIYDDFSTGLTPLEWNEVTAAAGNPAIQDRWGDSYSTRMNGLITSQWIGACYAVEASGVTPHVVRFGRERDGVTISGNGGVDGTTLHYDVGGPVTATADALGNYAFSVPFLWSGQVTPSLSALLLHAPQSIV